MKKKLTIVLSALTIITLLHTVQQARAQTGNWKLAGNNLAGTEKFGSKNGFPVSIVTNNVERMLIDSGGDITMGSGSGPLHFLFFRTSFHMKFPQNQYIFRHSNSQEGLYNNQSLQRIEYRDQVSVPNIWHEWASTGRSYFRGNVGIGADPNATRLFVKSTTGGELTRYDGGNGMFSSIYENGVYRGYWGSFAGSAEDVDIGTGGGNTTGRLHLTIQAVPKVTIDASGRMGVGTTAPEANLHVFRGSAGSVTANSNAPFVVENSTSNYINLLTPDANERGILFGDNLNAQDGGIIYVGTNNSMQFRTNGNATRMVLTDAGSLGLGTFTPSRKLQVQDGDFRISRSASAARYLEFVSTALSQNDVRLEHNSTAGSLYFSSSSDDFSTFTDLARFDLSASPSYVFTVYGSALASGGSWDNSDIKLKKNIAEFGSAMDIIKQLKPKTYFFKTDEYKRLNLPGSKQYGFIAQDLEKVLPELVKTAQQPGKVNSKGEREMEEIKAVNYTELIPILTRAIQEQQQQIEELKQIINSKSAGQSITTSAGANEDARIANNVAANSSLQQNNPNPFSGSTSIRYNIPAGARNAQLIITNLSGNIIKRIPLNTFGTGNVNVDASALINGTYSYTLLVDGKTIDSKKMIISR